MVGGVARHVVSYMKDFLFAPEQAGQPVSALSGGERGRLMLARALATSSNLLVLDEPTNDLDLETLDLLQEAIADYPGTVLLVSHDRDFLDRTVTSLLAAEGDGRWVEYAGGYSDMLAQRGGVPLSAWTASSRAPRSDGQARHTPARSSAPKRKLGFREKHALAALPGRIADLNSRSPDCAKTSPIRNCSRAIRPPSQDGGRSHEAAREPRQGRGRMAGAGNPARGDRGLRSPRRQRRARAA